MNINVRIENDKIFTMQAQQEWSLVDLMKAVHKETDQYVQYKSALFHDRTYPIIDISNLKKMHLQENDTIIFFRQQVDSKYRAFRLLAQYEYLNYCTKENFDKERRLLKQGYPDSLFSQSSDLIIDLFRCQLCQSIFNDPYQDPHGHSYCLHCFKTQIQKFKKCPLNGTDKITIKDISKNEELQSLLNSQISFCLQREKGCKWEGELGELKTHIQKECSFFLMKCDTKNCKFIGYYKDIQNHKPHCITEKSICECGEPIQADLLEFHKENFCSHKILQCQFCFGDFQIHQLETHFKECVLNTKTLKQCKICGMSYHKSHAKQHQIDQALLHDKTNKQMIKEKNKIIKDLITLNIQHQQQIAELQSKLRQFEVQKIDEKQIVYSILKKEDIQQKKQTQQIFKFKCEKCKNNGCMYHQVYHSCVLNGCLGVPVCQNCLTLSQTHKNNHECIQCEQCKGQGYFI